MTDDTPPPTSRLAAARAPHGRTPIPGGSGAPDDERRPDERGGGLGPSDTDSADQPGSQAIRDFQSATDDERIQAAKERIQAAMREQRQADGTFGPTHGGRMLRIHGDDALDPSTQGVVDDLRALLDVPEGVLAALKDRAARSLLVVGVVEAYVERKVAEGKDLADILVLARWPAFHNAAERSLVALAAALPKTSPHEDERKRVIELLDTLRQVRPDERQAEPDEEPDADG